MLYLYDTTLFIQVYKNSLHLPFQVFINFSCCEIPKIQLVTLGIEI